MKLNIYVISHPLIKILTTKTISYKSKYVNFTNKYENYQYLGILLMYEVLRKWIKINNIYIKKLDYIHEISMMDNEQKNYIITNIINNYHVITKIQNIFPQTELKHIDIHNTESWKKIDFPNINSKTNLIILENFLNNDKILSFINYINRINKIDYDYIKIACITCTHKILEKISIQHTDLNIYTTKIIND